VRACGDLTVEVMANRDGDPNYELNADQHRREMLFREYVEMVSARDESNDVYLVANNHFFEQPGTRVLIDELMPLPRFLDPGSLGQRLSLWFGPRGTVTPLHHDTMNVLLAQIRGRKAVTLIPPSATPLVYNEIGVYSRVDVEHPDDDTFPLFAAAPRSTFVLRPGEALFIPVGWWHHVRALDESISVSFQNFIYPNDFEAIWRQP
jgi:ribosomal protein L16 Arg81 hydroxylase